MKLKAYASIAACTIFVSTVANAGDLVLMTNINPNNTESGRLVELRDTARDGCRYVGVFQDAGPEHPLVWGMIKLERKQCGDLVSSTSGSIGLSRTHTYMDDAGSLRPGYQGGEAVGSIR